MSLRIPPIVQFLVCGLLAWRLTVFLPIFNISSAIVAYIGYALIAGCVILLALSVLAFVRARTTFNPIAPENAQTLVTTGLYSFARNPMYLAMALILLGGALVLGNFAALAAPAIFVWSMTILQIKPEERALQSIFGEAFTAYRAQTRRWL